MKAGIPLSPVASPSSWPGLSMEVGYSRLPAQYCATRASPSCDAISIRRAQLFPPKRDHRVSALMRRPGDDCATPSPAPYADRPPRHRGLRRSAWNSNGSPSAAELAAVLTDPCRDGTLDLGVGPRPDALGLALGDVARHRHAPRSLELEAAGAEPSLELADALLHRRMAFHAVGDGGEVEAVLQPVAEHGFGIGLLGAGENLTHLRHFVDWIRYLVLDRLERLYIGDDRVHVLFGDDVIETGRHDGGDGHPVRPYAGAQQFPDVGRTPCADAGLLVLGDVGRRHFERRLVEFEEPRNSLVHDVAGRALRRMAVAAGKQAVDQIVAALDQRRLRIGSAERDNESGK